LNLDALARGGLEESDARSYCLPVVKVAVSVEIDSIVLGKLVRDLKPNRPSLKALTAIQEQKMPKAITAEEFFARCREVHGDKYDYSDSIFSGTNRPITIRCPEHGEWTSRAKTHMYGAACLLCSAKLRAKKAGDVMRHTTEQVVAEFRAVHGDKYDYSRVEYRTNHTKVTIICPEHGEFKQAPSYHKGGGGCPACSYEDRGDLRRRTTDNAIAEFRCVHGDKYDYSQVEYKGAHAPITVICLDHGPFETTSNEHLRGTDCPKCALVSRSGENHVRAIPADEAVARYRETFGDRYDLSMIVEDWAGSKAKVRIRCPKHGIFESRPSDAWRGIGCPGCGVETRLNQAASGRSRLEAQMIGFIESLGFETRHGYLRGDATWTFDAVVERLKVAFEFNGVYWHSQAFASRGDHYYKRLHAERQGYRMVTVWEDDWLFRQDQIKAMIRATLGLAELRLDAGQVNPTLIQPGDAESFHAAFSPHEHTPTADLHVGITYCGELLAVASFRLDGTLARYTLKPGVAIERGIAAVVGAYCRAVEVEAVVVYCDRDYSDGSEYIEAGFEKQFGRIPRRQRMGHVGWTSGEDVLALDAANHRYLISGSDASYWTSTEARALNKKAGLV
jgi:hypothetical protein